MPKIKTIHPQDFEEYVREIGTVNAANGGRSWYRGITDKTHKLVPGLYRHHESRIPERWAEVEQEMMLSFAQRSMPFVERPITSPETIKDDEWFLLFYMQHYKIPTRLLDWSESPFTALYFAVTGKFEPSSKTASGEMEFESDAAVWILNPTKWNTSAWDNFRWKKGIAYTNEANLNSYRPPLRGRDNKDIPIAMHGSHNSPRIVAQRGTFTIFGASTQSMEEHFSKNKNFSDQLVKVVIAKKLIPAFRNSLFSYGVTESVIYPDLEGLSHEIKREFGFEE
jgi:hypothetical protein